MTRHITYNDALLPGDTHPVSGMRHLSMASIALLQVTNNKVLKVLMDNEELPTDDNLEVLKFIYIHTGDFEQVARECMLYSSNPFLLDHKALLLGETLTPSEASGYIIDIMRDRDNINNAKTRIIDTEKKGHKRKNWLSQMGSYLWQLVWRKSPAGASEQ